MKSCEEARERLIDAVFGEVDDRDEALLNEHLLACDRCRSEEAELWGWKSRLQSALGEVPEPADALRLRIEAATRAGAVTARWRAGSPGAGSRPEGRWGWLRRPIPVYAAAAAILLTAVLLRWGSGSHPEERSLRPVTLAVQESTRFAPATAEETGLGAALWAARRPVQGRSSAGDSL